MKVVDKNILNLYDLKFLDRDDLIFLIKERFKKWEYIYVYYRENEWNILPYIYSNREREETDEERINRERKEEDIRREELKQYRKLREKYWDIYY